MGIDIIFAILLVLAIYKGFTRGLIVAVFSFVAVLLGTAAALKLTTVAALYAQEHWEIQSRWLPVLCFILLFLAVVVVVRIGAIAIQKIVEAVMLGWLNKLGGILLYAGIFTILYSVLLWIANQLYWLSPEVKLQSVVYPYISPIGPAVMNGVGKLIPAFKDMFTTLESFFDKAAAAIQAKS
ncbi:CvpA family protein [Chitinophaga pendula]|uniref:CvpA family protein n=1 Tax=Chitinophaga TaxID=79328 RepID=UPI000BB056F2|nr:MULTISPECIES: CvpA family protein [Chitinophaga]ASZ10643.1 colicin V production protein [Chitinophaga sp. MD30]UCJ06380.1 CvpA family protein [Chitinophaga pendula]